MSQAIDERIVSMQFNNKDFESNVQTSLQTLETLRKSLDKLEDSSQSLSSISEKVNKVDFSKIEENVDNIAKRFTTLGIAGQKVISDFTKFAEKKLMALPKKLEQLIGQGGLNRALNIEKAKFQLEGMGIAWNQIEDDINHGVKDTAYSLDAAANVASQLVASQVALGDEMKKSLRGISGVAAMTQSSYEEIGHIFTTVAGQGKVMTMQLRQIEMRGLNAASTIADFMNEVNDETTKASQNASEAVKEFIKTQTNGAKVTEKTVRDMVSKGQVDFKLFSEAMDNAFGEHAKDSNKTFQGVLSNIKSAWSRVGQIFYQPLVRN